MVGRWCCAEGCTNKARNTKEVRYHSFPSNSALREKWLCAVRRVNWSPGINACVCSDHFTQDSYKCSALLMEEFGLAKPNYRRRLKEDAVPTVFVYTEQGQPQYLPGEAAKRQQSEVVPDPPYAAEQLDDPLEGSADIAPSFQTTTSMSGSSKLIVSDTCATTQHTHSTSVIAYGKKRKGGRWCCVEGCKNKAENTNGVCYHSFPSNSALREKWLHAVGRVKWSSSKNSCVCSDHFTQESYECSALLMEEFGLAKPNYRRRLKEGAVPTVFVHAKRGQPQYLPGEATEQQQREVVQDPPYTAEQLDHSLEGSADISPSCQTTTSTAGSGELTGSDMCATTQHTRSTDVQTYLSSCTVATQTYIENSSVGIQADRVLVRDSTMQTSDMLTNDSKEFHQEQRRHCSTPKRDICAPYLDASGLDCDDLHACDDLYACDELDSDEDDRANESSYVCDELDEGDSDAEPPAPEAPVQDSPDGKKYIVFHSCLIQLLKKCRVCGGDETTVDLTSSGTMICATMTCSKKHVTKWCSQPIANNKPLGNVLLCSAILFTGSSPTKVIRLLSVMGVQSLQKTQYFQYQRCYLLPAVQQAWLSHQKDLLEEAKQQPLSLAGDGRCDTPGHSADFGTYTLMDTSTNKVLHMELVKSTEVSCSNKMEKEGLQRALDYLTEQEVVISSLVTDRHSEIKAFLKKYYPYIKHLFDLWHIGKGLRKKISSLGRAKQHEIVLGWRKTIIRHLYWCAVNSDGDDKLLLARWLSILRHIVNVHDHPNPLHPFCLHGPLPSRDWLLEGSESFRRLRSILAAPFLLRDLPNASPSDQTFGLESFHSVLIHFAPKSSKFSYEGMLARTQIAALHYNENSSKAVLTDVNGVPRVSQKFSRGEKEWTVVPVKEKSGYGYVSVLINNVMDCIEKWPSFSDAEQASVHHHHDTLFAKHGPKPTKEECRLKQSSRFAVQQCHVKKPGHHPAAAQ